MLSKDDIEEMSKESAGTLKAANKAKEEIVRRQTGKIEKQYGEIENRVIGLEEQKIKTAKGPLPKSEVCALVKEKLRLLREEALDILLKETVEDCQKFGSAPFDGPGFRVNVLNGRNLFKFIFLALSEKDIDDAVSKLPEIGMPEAEKKAKIKEINQEISQVVSGLKKELKEVKKGFGGG